MQYLPLLVAMLDRYDLVMLSHIENRKFEIIGHPPDWVNKIYPQLLSNPVELFSQPSFSYFENFLKNAEAFWEEKSQQSLKSAIWREYDASGNEHYLEATALYISGQQILLIDNLGAYYQEMKGVMKRARENALQNEQFSKIKEQLIRTKTKLENANQQVETFAKLATKDLMEPMQTIQSYIQLLERRYKDRLDEEGERFVSFIATANERMQHLIDNLISYASIEEEELRIEPVNCQKVVQKAVSGLSKMLDASGIQIAKTALPTVEANPDRLTQLFENLISNAVKFRSEKSPQILISALSQQSHWLFTVRDNGVGMPMEMIDTVFAPFKENMDFGEVNGNGNTDLPGNNGFGLSLCKKIVERHSGEIWIESTPNVGTTIYFTLPHNLQVSMN